MSDFFQESLGEESMSDGWEFFQESLALAPHPTERRARAPRTQHPERVHVWVPRDGEWAESVVSLCGGIEAEESFLVKTGDVVDCPACRRELA